MRNRFRPAAALLSLPLALGSLGLLLGCEESSARAHANAQQTIDETSRQLRSLIATAPDSGDDQSVDDARRKLGEIASRLDRLDGAAAGQQAAAALLRSSVQTQLGRLETERFKQQQQTLRGKRSELSQILSTAAALARLAESAERFDPRTERAMLEAVRAQARTEIDALKAHIADLDRPMQTLADENRSNRTAAQALDGEERSLRQDARDRGYAAGYPIFVQAIDRRKRSDALRIQTARNDIQLSELQPERELATVEVSMVEAMTEAIAAAERDLADGVDVARERAASLRSTANDLHQRARQLVEEINAGLRGPVTESFDRAVRDLEQAVQSAGRATTGDVREAVAAARQAAFSARQTLATLHANRLLETRDTVAMLAATHVAAGQSRSAEGLVQAIASLREQQSALEPQLREQAQQAISAAIEATNQLGDRPAVTQSRDALTRMLTAIGSAPASTASPTAPAADAAASGSAAGSAGMESAEAVVAFLNAMDPADPASGAAFFELMRSGSGQGRQLLNAVRGMFDDSAAMSAAVAERWGVEALAENSPVPMHFAGSLQLGAATDRDATITGPDLDRPIRLVRSAGRWFIDADSVIDPSTAAELGPMLGMLDQMRPAMRRVSDQIAERIRAGEFDTIDDAMSAYQTAVMTEMMSGAMGDMSGK